MNEWMEKIRKIDEMSELSKECKFWMNDKKTERMNDKKYWKFGMIEWMDKRKERRNKWMNQKNEILGSLEKSNLKWWIYAKLELEKRLLSIFHFPMQWQERPNGHICSLSSLFLQK